jgi:hypothetical protein
VASQTPLEVVSLRAGSNVDDLAFVALTDAISVFAENAEGSDIRLIGGLMMEIHRARWGLGADLVRETRDADFGGPLLAASVFEDVDIALETLGYKRVNEYRYERPVDDLAIESTDRRPLLPAGPADRVPLLRATLDLVQVRALPLSADPTVDELSGMLDPVAIAEALSRPPVVTRLELTRRNGEQRAATATLADEASSVILKAYAWRARGSSRDIHDLWRTMAIAARAGCTGADFATDAGDVTRRIIATVFDDPNGANVRTLAERLQEDVDVAHTSIAALRHRLGL